MELDQRKLQILRVIVDEYILSASPVGSKALSQSGMKWSSATIRNEMADLETLGYLAQPHTSAGRIPSEKAYRLYVDQMMQRAHLSDEESKLLYGYFREHVHGVDAVLRATAKALSEITHYTALVMMPDIGVNRLRHLQLIPLTTGKALAVVVTDAGVSQNTVIDVPEDIGPEELDRISKAITARFSDCRMSTVSSSSVASFPPARTSWNRCLRGSARASRATGAWWSFPARRTCSNIRSTATYRRQGRSLRRSSRRTICTGC